MYASYLMRPHHVTSASAFKLWSGCATARFIHSYARSSGICPRHLSAQDRKFHDNQASHKHGLSAKRSSNIVIPGVRWSSSTAVEALNKLDLGSTSAAAVSSLPPGYIPEPPLPPVGGELVGSEVVQQLTSLGEPTLVSLGLCTWWPSGLVQSLLETVHVGLNVPWWTSIIITTVCVRLAVFPLVILAQRNMANMHNHMPIVQKLQEKFTASRVSGNPIEAARAGEAYMSYMKKNNVSPIKSMMVPFAQAPIFLSIFFGIKRMADLPVESMTRGGVLWFTDLTITDPYYALPLLTAVTFLASLELGVDGVRAASMSNNVRYFMRAMPFLMLPFIINFPSAMLCYWLTSNVISFFQVLFLKIPGVRAFFKIPAMVVHPPELTAKNKKPFFKGIKDNYRNSKNMVSMEERQRAEAVKFKQAGLGAIQKTYDYDPTKAQPKISARATTSMKK